jgi:O6-methylguanine-DNA--protein-cysteine methyltransferase
LGAAGSLEKRMSNRVRNFKYKSPVGIIYCVFDGHYLLEISIKAGNRREAIGNLKKIIAYRLFSELDAYFKGDLKKFSQEIKFISGTDFEQKVWLAL